MVDLAKIRIRQAQGTFIPCGCLISYGDNIQKCDREGQAQFYPKDLVSATDVEVHLIMTWKQFLDDNKNQFRKSRINEYSNTGQSQLTGYQLIDYINRLNEKIQFFSKRVMNVLIVVDNSISSLVLVNSVLYTGHNAIFVNHDLNEAEMRSKIKLIKPDLILLPIRYEKKISLVVDIEKIPLGIIDKGYQLTINENISSCKLLSDATKDAIVFFSSGTGGEEKGVVLHQLGVIDSINIYKDESNKEKLFSALLVIPLSTAYAFSVSMSMLVAGKSLTLVEASDEKIDEIIKKQKIDVFPVVPLIIDKIHEKIMCMTNQKSRAVKLAFKLLCDVSYWIRKETSVNIGRFLFSRFHHQLGASLRIILSGGSSLNINTLRDLCGMGFTIYEGYGLTETCGVVTMRKMVVKDFGTVGKIMDDCKIKLSEDNEILITSPRLFMRYWNHESKTGNGEWFPTGDLGRFDKNNNLILMGRKKDCLVLSNEKKIQPQILEEYYEKLFANKAFIIIGILSPEKSGDKLVLVIEGCDENELIQYRRKLSTEVIAKQFQIDDVVSYPIFPRTALGKIKRSVIKKYFEECDYVAI